MSFQLILKELCEFVSDRRFVTLMFVTVLLALITALDGWQRANDATRLKQEIVQIDRDTWLEQGEANPHDAAHFGRYALRPVPALSAFDPGIFDFAGAAVWMEAHFQNPPSLRRAENIVISYPLSFISPSWALSVLGSLVVVALLFGAISRERESGTMRLLIAHNVSATQFIHSKLGAIGLFSLIFSVSLVALSVAPIAFHKQLSLEIDRLVVLLLAFAALYGVIGLLTLAISAIMRNSTEAFMTSVLIWIAMVFAVPLAASQLATSMHPTPRDRDFAAAIQQQAQAPFWTGAARFEAVATYEAEVMTKHRAQGFDSLGFNRDGLVLQAHERFANRVYDRLYGGLYASQASQDEIVSWASALSPVLALQRIASGIAGTDLQSQLKFANAAEQHRRIIIRQLNEDMMHHASDRAFSYTAGKSLWAQIEDFKFVEPSVNDVLRSYRFEVISILVWLVLGYSAALLAVLRRFKQENP